MKKKKLYKLVKEQLKIALKEAAFKIKTDKRNKSVLDKRKPLREQQDTETLQKAYDFLVVSYQNGVTLEEILESPTIANLNVSVIEQIYSTGTIATMTFEDFAGSFQTTWYSWGDSTGCANPNFDYGDITIYADGDCSSTVTINDSWVCCSQNNNNINPHAAYGALAGWQLTGGTAFNPQPAASFGGNSSATGTDNNPTCYCPNPSVDSSGLLTCGSSISTTDFENWFTLLQYYYGAGFTLQYFNGSTGGGCAGCGQLNASNYGTNPWIGGPGGTGGCPTDGSTGSATWNGQLDVYNLSCCTFQGCNENGAIPAPNNLSDFTLNNGTVITANNIDPWFQNDNTCEYDGCPGYSVTIFGTIYEAPMTVPGGTLVNPGAGYTINEIPGVCLMDGCTDTTIQFIDPYTGVNYPNNYIAPTANYDVLQTNAICEIEACIDPTDLNGDTNLNYVDTSTWPTTWNIINTGCVSTGGLTGGCLDPNADNYDPTVDYDDGSCVYLGCTDPNASNYDQTAVTDDGSCLYPGCMLGDQLNTLTSNHNGNANVEDNSCIVTACDDPTANNYFCDLVDGSIIVGNDYCTGWTGPGTGTPDPSAMASFTPDSSLCTYDPGCTHPNANNYDPVAQTDDGTCEWNYCNNPAAFNFNTESPYMGISWDNLDTTPIVDNSLCEFMGCAVDVNNTNSSYPSIPANIGAQGEDNGYHPDNDGCIPGIPAGLTLIPHSGANSISITGQLDPSDISCCEFPGCYNLGNPTYNRLVGGVNYTDAPDNYNLNATIDDGTCEYNGCSDPNASNYFCGANVDLCDGQVGGTLNPIYGTLVDDGTCEYNHCADVEAVRCSNPSQTTNPSQPTINVQCLTINGQLPDVIINNQFLSTFTPPTRPDQLDEQIAASGCWKVTSVTPSQIGTQIDRPSCICDPNVTYECCTFGTCPGSYQWWLDNKFPGWQAANPNYPPPKPNMALKFCMPKFDGSGQYTSESQCEKMCGSTRNPRDLGISPINQSLTKPSDTSTKFGEEELDIPELRESKKLRKLIKQWRKKNL